MVNQSILETAERFVKLIPANLMMKRTYLFGSYAKGVEREESDVDIAIVLGNMDDFLKLKCN
jgi:predicted nucleotidyltransferase